ncbi:unnamed protein product [Lota lota]
MVPGSRLRAPGSRPTPLRAAPQKQQHSGLTPGSTPHPDGQQASSQSLSLEALAARFVVVSQMPRQEEPHFDVYCGETTAHLV